MIMKHLLCVWGSFLISQILQSDVGNRLPCLMELVVAALPTIHYEETQIAFIKIYAIFFY